MVGPAPRISGSGGLGCGPRFCASDKFQVMMMMLLLWTTKRLLRTIALSTLLYLTTWESAHEHPDISKCNNPNIITSRWKRTGVCGHRHWCVCGEVGDRSGDRGWGVSNWIGKSRLCQETTHSLYRNQWVKQRWVDISMQLRWEHAPIPLQVFWRNETNILKLENK